MKPTPWWEQSRQHLQQNLSGCSANKDNYLNAEAKAKQQRLGYWN
ncbi:hypothetical protein [Planktothrix prolifica]|jgi:hypothetical protein|nr:hypothetical protein [Planktothrix prolifica]CAD5984291.1 hypothetical protein NO108_04939 [Planktothrix rubescens]